MDNETIKELATDINRIAESQYQQGWKMGREEMKRDIQLWAENEGNAGRFQELENGNLYDEAMSRLVDYLQTI